MEVEMSIVSRRLDDPRLVETDHTKYFGVLEQ